MRINQEAVAVEAILFDFDGTLFDTISLIVESYQHVYKEFALREHSEEEILAGIGLPLEEIFSEYPDLQEELLKEYLRFNHSVTKQHVGIYLGIVPMLEGLREKGIPLGIVTAKREESLLPTLRQFEAEPYFEVIVSKGDTDKHKPDPEPLLLGMKKLGLSHPEQILYVGDSIYDLQAAHNGGFLSAAVGWSAMPHEALKAEQPSLWIDQASDLVSLCDKSE